MLIFEYLELNIIFVDIELDGIGLLVVLVEELFVGFEVDEVVLCDG